MAETDLHSLLEQLIQLPKEIEWVECKHNFHSPEEVGQQLSALSNSACLHNQNCGFLIYGIQDEAFQIIGSRNEALASLMRRLRIFEEKGSGVDKVIHDVELFQLPAPDFRVKEKQTLAILFAHLTLNEMHKDDRIRACYQHSCLKYVSNEKMTNQSLRERFNIEDQNAAIASRIIKETLAAGLIKEDDPDNKSRKYTRYVPNWA